jgi:hypothetical protein
MKKLSLFIAGAIVFFASCSKEVVDEETKDTFSAKFNGTSYTFNIDAALLFRYPTTSEKRLIIAGTSTDGITKLTITVWEGTAAGAGISLKSYIIRLSDEDDPATPEDESQDSMDGNLTLGKKIGSSWWSYHEYAENGTINISSCNEANTTISGTFQAELTDLINHSEISITAGTFSNIKYTIID